MTDKRYTPEHFDRIRKALRDRSNLWLKHRYVHDRHWEGKTL